MPRTEPGEAGHDCSCARMALRGFPPNLHAPHGILIPEATPFSGSLRIDVPSHVPSFLLICSGCSWQDVGVFERPSRHAKAETHQSNILKHWPQISYAESKNFLIQTDSGKGKSRVLRRVDRAVGRCGLAERPSRRSMPTTVFLADWKHENSQLSGPKSFGCRLPLCALAALLSSADSFCAPSRPPAR